MTRGTVFNPGDDYPNAEASPGLSPEDARIELLFIESAQAGVVARELGRQRREGKAPKLRLTLPLRVALCRRGEPGIACRLRHGEAGGGNEKSTGRRSA